MVDYPPHEWQVLVCARLLGAEVGAALGHMLERFVDQREGVAVVVQEHHRVERAAASVANADPDGAGPNYTNQPAAHSYYDPE